MVKSWSEGSAPPNFKVIQVNPEYECYIDHSSTILGKIDLGRFTYISNNCFLFGRSQIRIGSFCSIGPHFHCATHEQHPMQFAATYPMSQAIGVPLSRGDAKGLDPVGNVIDDFPVDIGNDVWIGEQVTLSAGITIGDGCVIGTKSLVTKDCIPYGIYGGTPAKLIRMRFPDQIIEQLLALKWWEWSLAKLRANAHFFEIDLTQFEGTLAEEIREAPKAA